MSIKLTGQSFLNGLKQSGLVEADRYDALLAELESAGVSFDDSKALSDALIARRTLTEWQAEQLLQGRHKGFVLGRYRLLSLLGTGEMSAVFLAKHMMMDRLSAIKVLPGNRVKDTSYLGRFYREAKAVAALNHPNIIRAYDVDRQEGGGAEIHFLVMEYVPGKTIEKLLEERGPLDATIAADWFRQAAAGLAHAHQAGLVHRDVKPGNLLVDEQGCVKLLDLGLARFFKSSDEESLTLKHDEKVLGTADYLAPEQAIDSHTVDSRADIYALGCTFFAALTGHPPYTDGTLVQRLLAHQTKPIPSIRTERPDVPEAIEAIIHRMMAKKPEDRYQTADEVHDAILSWLAESGGADWKRRHREAVADLVLGARERTAPAAIEPASQLAARSTSTAVRSTAPAISKSLTSAPQPASTATSASAGSTSNDPNDWRLKLLLGLAVAVILLVTGLAVMNVGGRPQSAEADRTNTPNKL